MSHASQAISERLIRWRWILLGIAFAVVLVAYPYGHGLDFDRSIENMFAADDPILVSYRKLARVFGGNEIILAVYRDAELFNPDGSGLKRCAGISKRLSQVPGVRSVLSIDLLLGELIVDPESELARRCRELFRGYTHGSDGRTVAIGCMLLPQTDTEVPRRTTVDRMRQIMDDLPDGLAPGLLAGEPVMVTDGFRYVEQDGRRLGITSMILLSATIVVCFRSLRWVLVPIAVVQLSLLMTRAILAFSGLRLSMVSSMLTAVVTVVGVATVVHVIVRFRDARRSANTPREALLQAMTIVIAPVFWACCTDAVGFASLTVADVGPVQDFGTMMAVGSLMVVVSVALVIPGLVLLGRRDTDPHRAWGEQLLGVQLHRLVGWSKRYPARVGWGAALLTVAASAGIFRLEVETDFTKNFRADSPITRSYVAVEAGLGGAGVFDVVVPAPAKLDWKYLKRVLDLEQRLRDEAVVSQEPNGTTSGLTKVIGLADAIVAGSPADLERMSMGFVRETMVRSGLRTMRTRLPDFFDALYGNDPLQPEQYYFRIMLRARERQSSQAKRQLLDRVEQISREEFPDAEVTGFFVLLTNLIDSILRDQWVTFAVALIGIGCMMVVALRSIAFALIALVPNTIPILIVMGMMGWLGLKINLGATMIAAVSIGLSIDSSIHYITSFQRARAEGNRVAHALETVQQTVGRAVVFSTLALIVGFSVLCSSQFVPTIYFGFLVSLSMLGGLAGNLLVLPLLLSLVVRGD